MQQTPASKRITLVRREHYAIDLEYTGTVAILHLPYVTKFNKSVYHDIVSSVEDIWEFLSTINYTELFVGIPKEDKTIAKLVDKLGFIYLGNAFGIDVYQYKEYL